MAGAHLARRLDFALSHLECEAVKRLSIGVAALLVLAGWSLLVGATGTHLVDLLRGDPESWHILAAARAPRTLAIILAGSSMAIAGVIMQMLTQNRFVEPSTVGSVEAASLGLIVMAFLWPGAPLLVKMIVAAAFSLAGVSLFLTILSFVAYRSVLTVPIIGIMLGGIIGSLASFIAYRFDLLQSLNAWMLGDFSGVVRGRYELLWLAGALAAAAYVVADRFTVAGMGRDFATNLGLSYGRVMTIGLVIVSGITASVVVSVGMIPFLGLIVPNVVSRLMGDHVRRSIPWIALAGAGLALCCDILGRLVIMPYEIPVGTVFGVAGSGLFLWLLLRERARLA